MALVSVEEAIQDLQDGKLVILVDDEDRENEGDLIIAAEKITPEAINFMATYGRGLICMPVTGQRLQQLKLPMMVEDNTSRHSTAFTVSVDVTRGATTGISAFDRAATVKAMLDPNTEPDDLARPGHIFPLRYQEGGVLVRAGQTEGSVDLATLAGLRPAAVLCEIMSEDGTMARMPQLEEFSRLHDIRIISVAQIIAYRRFHETMVERVADARLPTCYGEFRAVAFNSDVDKA
ncbi:MAG: 3,4-dihydroxy-2-butanone-4-phosphate synthase, partial [Dehalococcoidia bacterium]|nr:3,4-dihydroxy-2-butanone-4-phosphate synthase [Dehalococcoidia bacterium]